MTSKSMQQTSRTQFNVWYGLPPDQTFSIYLRVLERATQKKIADWTKFLEACKPSLQIERLDLNAWGDSISFQDRLPSEYMSIAEATRGTGLEGADRLLQLVGAACAETVRELVVTTRLPMTGIRGFEWMQPLRALRTLTLNVFRLYSITLDFR